jgi:hypothetical protein
MSRDQIFEQLQLVGTEYHWRAMSFDDLNDRFVLPFNTLDEDDSAQIIQNLDNNTFDLWRKKLWDAQDIPVEEDGYARTLSICIALKKSLLYRLPVVETQRERNPLQQQLAHISIITNPVFLEAGLAGN